MKRCNRSLIMYEVRNIAGNIFVHLFGIGLPILLSLFISSVASKDVPEFMKQRVVTSVAITMSLIIPMAIMLIGYAANYAQEVERNVPIRMYLFGFSEKSMMLAKAIAQLIFLTGAMLIYMVAEVLFLDIQKPALLSFLCLLACLYLVGILFFLFAHGISNLLKKFGPTYAVTMTMYFLIMILSGMMGMGSDQLPEPMKTIAYTLPTTYISNEFIDFWQGQHYNFMPLIQSFLFLWDVGGNCSNALSLSETKKCIKIFHKMRCLHCNTALEDCYNGGIYVLCAAYGPISATYRNLLVLQEKKVYKGYKGV